MLVAWGTRLIVGNSMEKKVAFEDGGDQSENNESVRLGKSQDGVLFDGRRGSFLMRSPFRKPLKSRREGASDRDVPEREDQFPVYEGREVYGGRALLLFTTSSTPRRLAIRVVDSVWFDWFILAVIVANTVCLAIASPFDKPDSTKTKVLDVMEIVFVSIFTVEMLLKVLAKGFVLHRTAYLRNGWNVFDFLILIIGYLALFTLTRGGHVVTLGPLSRDSLCRQERDCLEDAARVAPAARTALHPLV